jgi:hypothetical protein
MLNKVNLLKKISFISILIGLFFTNISCSKAQDFSNGIIDFTYQPGSGGVQIVIWIEDGDGNYIETIFITDFIGRDGGGNRTDNPDIDYGTGNRWSAFPIWAHKRNVIDTTYGLDNLYPPSESQASYPDDLDAVSGATPTSGIQTKTLELSELEYGEYKCWIEVNKSFDNNDYHDYSYYRGQPSLVWNVTVNVGDSPDSSMVLNYTGYGSTDGSDGNINPPDTTITTAEDLLAEVTGYKFKAVYTPDVVGVDEVPNNSSSEIAFSLDQNYPNPFSASTVISYSLTRPAFVVLKVYDALGNEIRSLVSKFQREGSYDIAFNAENLSSGVYFFQLNVDGFLSEERKMLLAR